MKKTDSGTSETGAECINVPQLDVVEELGSCMSQFANTFEASARRWELVVYPSIIAFIVLAAYGFFLIYKLTNDIDAITHRVEAVAINMINVDAYMSQVVSNMDSIAASMKTMTPAIVTQSSELSEMTSNLQLMNVVMGNMTQTMHQLRYDTSVMGENMHNASGPMRLISGVMPW